MIRKVGIMMSKFWRIFSIIVGLSITFTGLIMWNIPLNESEEGTVELFNDDSGIGTPRDVGFTFWGFFNCFCFGPYIFLSGIFGAPAFISTVNWNYHRPEIEQEK